MNNAKLYLLIIVLVNLLMYMKLVLFPVLNPSWKETWIYIKIELFGVKNGGLSFPKASNASISIVRDIALNAKHIGRSPNGSCISFASRSSPKKVYATIALKTLKKGEHTKK